MPTRPKSKRRPWQPKREAFGRRTNTNSAFYNSREWRSTRRVYISQHPFCECDECRELPVPLPSEVVDHITPINQGGATLDWNNLQAMNSKCHNKKSGREARRAKQLK